LVLPGAEPWVDYNGDVGVVCCHGFTGSPSSMRPWAIELAAAGYSVSLPLLPGHGTRWQDLNRTAWTDWYGELERAFDDLAQRCRLVYVAGLSMGGTLTIRLAEERGEQLAGLVLVNPSLLTQRRGASLVAPLSHIIPAFPGLDCDTKKPGVQDEGSYDRTPLRAVASLAKLWRLARADLAQVTQPVVLYRSRVDHIVEPINSEILLAGIRSSDVTDVRLDKSYHVATLDNDAPTIFAGSAQWIAERSGSGRATHPAEAG
jgi:carboxylesterase